MKKREKKVYDDDDGRVIAPMNVDGMPWSKRSSPAPQIPKAETPKADDDLQLTDKEKRAMMGGVFSAAILIAGIFVLAGFLFILFCLFVWLK